MKRIIMSFALLLSCVFAVNVSAASDSSLPVVESIEVLTKEVAPGGKVKIKTNISDDLSGIKYATFTFHSPSMNVWTDLNLWIENSGSLTGEYILTSEPLSSYAELGEWKLTSMFVNDHAGNAKIIYPIWGTEVSEVMQNVSFNVDPNAPVDEVEKPVEVEKPTENEIIPEAPEVDDGFRELESKTDVPVNKEFKIKFNMDVDLKTFTDHNVYVLDQQGNKVPVMFIVDRKTNKSASDITIMPLNNYRSASTYTLYVKDVKSTSGKILKQNTKMKFTTK